MRKLNLAAYAIVGALILTTTPSAAFDMFKRDCISGPSSSSRDLNSALNQLDHRIVACHNFQNQLRNEDFERLAHSMTMLAHRVRSLETELERIKAEKQ